MWEQHEGARETDAVPPPLIPGSRSLRAMLPESYRAGDFADRFIAGFDDTLAPLIETLDCLEAYFSPRTAPADFLAWTLQWTGTGLPDAVDTTGRRNALLLGRRLHGLRGTRAGLELLAHAVLDGMVEVTESGGTVCSQWPPKHPMADDDAVRPVHSWADVHLVLSPAASQRCRGRTEDVEALLREWLPVDVASRVRVSLQSHVTPAPPALPEDVM
ncbi:hypothetical protein [Streptomyces kronopolitis]|uniref:hypothetical protein n=1 Tax=Streptomyces kronopolitis TaxID=1612435 RepID=UPI0020C04540|nr:hypothetical protein [Streptomyces kronopolitis]MCL6302591.1 hypothetical protein [Streptomyces kronopolitis]